MARKKPIKLVTLDTETYNGLLGDLKRIAIYDGVNVTYDYTFQSIEKELINLAKKWEVHVYIHNLEFDARKMDGLFDKGRVIWSKCFMINNKLATIKTKHYTIHDSYKLLPMSLSKLSKDFDVEHGKMNLWEEVQKIYPGQYKDLVDFLDRCHVDDELYLRYLGYDVISLYEILEKILDVSGLELKDFVKKPSTASLSRHLFKNGYKGKQFKNPLNSTTDYEILTQYNWKDNLELEQFLRMSYCGGRTEVFKPFLNHKGFHYDENSMYPDKMKEYEFPVGKPEYYNTPHIAKETFENWLKYHNGLGFVHAKIYIPMQHIPPLPVKMGKLVFPCGHVFGVWTYAELEYAINNCGVEIIEIFSVCHFSNTYKVFYNFINDFYWLKEQATEDKNESLRAFAKLMMNVGYGYTGMSREDKTQLKDIDEYIEGKIEESTIKYIDYDLGYVEVYSDINADYIQVAVASYVTSYARIDLLQKLRYADEKGEVYYCDTDSLVTDVTLPDEWLHPSKLGFWDLESEPQKALFLRPKVYAEVLEDREIKKFKGITKDTQDELHYNDYENLYNELVEGTKDSIVIEKNKTVLRSIMYMKKNNIDFSYYEVRDKKMNLLTVEKREINYEENWTKPLYFDSIEDFQGFSFNKVKKEIGF